ncbi:mucin-3A-like [Hyposmocoma kahamanoa]|uniref:mucin-3A-like n=1 Tax=Hyposmocoma kahamanoa TaxID=1477025 RepID=UPI000E6D8577|nr:mucin-3A-like [Hyposmocoma kahamanoa]
MARHALACLFIIVAVAAKEQSRWSRQISSYTSDISDWVPLPGPVEREIPRQPQLKRQAIAEPRILAEPVFPGFTRPTGFSQDFPSRTYFNAPTNRQLYLQSVPAVPSAPQNYLTDQGFRFGLSQPNFPLNQGFIGPQFPFDTIPMKQRPPIISNPIAFPKSNLPSPQARPFPIQVQKKPESPKLIDGYRVENISVTSAKKPQSLQKLKYETFDKFPKTEMVPPKPKTEREEVQLLYVPLESLNRGQFNFRYPISHMMNTEKNNQAAQRQNLPKQTFLTDFQKPSQSQSVESFDPDYFTNFNSQFGAQLDQTKFSTISAPFLKPTTTPKPKKLKPHQPPLAIFMTQEAKKGDQVKVGDVLTSLKNAETIAVLDSVNPQTAPKVFIGPSNLSPPETFVKFELPYLSNIEHNDKKLRSLPFFVAPLSYKTPQGFAKIPFPSPHVGSVIINAQIKDSTSTIATPAADVIPNSYSSPQPRPVLQAIAPVVTEKPSYTFYSTTPPKTNAPVNHDANYYTFEPQTVSTLRPPKEPQASLNPAPQRNSYFLNNDDTTHFPAPHIRFEPKDSIRPPSAPVKAFNIEKQTTPTTSRTTLSSTTSKPSTYPSQLLETHNPYSINQAFHFSTPLDYHNLFEENYPARGIAPQNLRPPFSPQTTKINPSTTAKSIDPVTEQHNYQTPRYVQNYSPEIHYESEVQNSRYPQNEYTTKPAVTFDYRQPANPIDDTQQSTSSVNPTEYTNVDTQTIINENVDYAFNKQIESSSNSPYTYDQYETNGSEEKQTSPSTSTTTTSTTTRRTPIRNRGRPRYTTTPRAESGELFTKSIVTRRPLRERRPLPTRPKFEHNKITSERSTRKPVESNESTTKYSRGRTRGRIHYKPSDSDDYYGKANKHTSSKENDLAYQRDILHQNYPVTLMERASTVDIEAITEPAPRISSTRNLDTTTEVYDTENADSNDNRAISQHLPNTASKEETQTYTNKAEFQTEETIVPKVPSTHADYTFQSRSSIAPFDAITFYDDIAGKEDDIYVKSTTSSKTESPEVTYYATETFHADAEEALNFPSYSINNNYSKEEKHEETTTPAVEITKITQDTQSVSQNAEPEENVVQTTPSYNRVRVRPGLIRQYHQASTESTRTKADRKRPIQAITYRPAFNNRRTTMRIEEIEADLKTKQVHARPEVQDYRHPVYRPEPTTEPAVTSGLTQETTTKRGVFRRRRPTYTTTTTSTEASSSTKKTVYEIKSRFRGRRPTEKTSEKPEVHTEATQPTSTTIRSTHYNRYSNRQRLSERYNKKSESESSDDQDSNYSILRPKYAEPESDHWSPKISSDSFKPYNPNDIIDVEKAATTERRSDLDDDIITARNDYDDILVSVTPASNTRGTKRIPDIPPTLKAFVEQSKITKNDSSDGRSTFETMLEEVMKTLEEQDEDEYSTNVMKHKGGEIGEIPPERIISSGDNYKSTTVEQDETTTAQPVQEETTIPKDEEENKSRRRGFWKKVKVRPVTESIETAESQYYPNSANRLSHTVTLTKTVHDKNGKYGKPKVTTYKPTYQILHDVFDIENEEELDMLSTVDIPKITNKPDELSEVVNRVLQESTESIVQETTEPSDYPGDMDLGTGTPDPNLDTIYVTTPEPVTTSESSYSLLERADGFSLMDYLFGSDDLEHKESKKDTKKAEKEKLQENKEKVKVEITTEQPKPKLATTESTYIPEELTALPSEEDKTESVTEKDLKKLNAEIYKLEKIVNSTEKPTNVESSSVSSFMDPDNIVSTSMSTEISHETEICFRGKCIKTSKDIL